MQRWVDSHLPVGRAVKQQGAPRGRRRLRVTAMSADSRVVLLGWELGAGLGHARRLLHVARDLRRRGWLPVVAARHLWALSEEYRSAGIPLVQAPLSRLSPPRGGAFEARGYADIMAACGYQRLENLWPTIVGWDGLIAAARPRAIIGDYSPMLALAALGRVPLIAVGSGFAVPPPHLPHLPQLRPNGTPMLDEEGMLRHAGEVQRRRGLALPASIPGLVGGQAHTVCTFPEVDVYADQREGFAAGPVAGGLQPLPRAGRPAIFAYLEAESRFTGDVIRLLLAIGAPLEAFVRNSSDRQNQALRRMGVRVHDVPPPLPDVLSRSSAIVHHGGIGTMEAALALGRPQLVAPLQLEQMANAKRLLQLGGAAFVLPEHTPQQNREIAERLIGSRAAADRAAEVAALIASRSGPSSLERIAAACETLATR